MTIAAMEALDWLKGWLLQFGAAQIVRVPLEKLDTIRAAFPVVVSPASELKAGDA